MQSLSLAVHLHHIHIQQQLVTPALSQLLRQGLGSGPAFAGVSAQLSLH